jgi:hypothetical protein
LRWDLIGGKVRSPGRRINQETPEDGPGEVDMGRYVILLIAPVIIGVLIAAGVVVIHGLRRRGVDNALRQHRIEARRTLLEMRRQDRALSAADPAVTQQSSDLSHRRIAS